MSDAQRFPYSTSREKMALPELSLELMYQNRSASVSGLLDTGSTVNVLPYAVGLTLGAVWNDQGRQVRLTGNLARFEARPLILAARVGQFQVVELIFAWTQSNDVPVILGQFNFFQEFNVCFYRAEHVFELHQHK